MPALALDMLRLLAAQLEALDVKLMLIDGRLMALHRENPVSQCLASQSGIGPIGAVSFALRVTDPRSFRSGRHFAAWLGLTPKDNSSGGKRRQGRISGQGNEACANWSCSARRGDPLRQAGSGVALVAQSASA